jgi:hypothetical protein
LAAETSIGEDRWIRRPGRQEGKRSGLGARGIDRANHRVTVETGLVIGSLLDRDGKRDQTRGPPRRSKGNGAAAGVAWVVRMMLVLAPEKERRGGWESLR